MTFFIQDGSYFFIPSIEDDPPYLMYHCHYIPDIRKVYEVIVLLGKQQEISERVLEILEEQIKEHYYNYHPYEGMT